MFDGLREFLKSIGGGGQPNADAPNDPRIAAAALLFHVAEADGRVTEAEALRLRASVSEAFGLDDEETRRVLAAGREADQDAVDLYHFTSILKAGLDEARRIHFVELLWRVTYADGEVHELEDNTIWRIADLLGVSTRDRMLTKREAALATGAEL